MTPTERQTLADFLVHPEHEGRAMNMAMLQGYLAALVIGPSTVAPSLWFARVWDHEHGKQAPVFDSMDEANAILGSLIACNNEVSEQFARDPAGFLPLFAEDATTNADDWGKGFYLAMGFARSEWARLMSEHPAWFQPLLQPATPADAAKSSAALAKIHTFWQHGHPARAPQEPLRRVDSKISRNDPCPCGSGKKFKKCCG